MSVNKWGNSYEAKSTAEKNVTWVHVWKLITVNVTKRSREAIPHIETTNRNKDFQKFNGFQPWGALPWPRPPGHRWGLHPQTSVVGSRCALTMCVQRTLFEVATPLPAEGEGKFWT